MLNIENTHLASARALHFKNVKNFVRNHGLNEVGMQTDLHEVLSLVSVYIQRF